MAVLIRGLPRESATIRSVRPDSQWTTTEELLAVLAELTDYGNRLYFSAHSKKKAPDPLKIPRPRDQAKAAARAEGPPRGPSSPTEVKQFFAGAITVEGGPNGIHSEPQP